MPGRPPSFGHSPCLRPLAFCLMASSCLLVCGCADQTATQPAAGAGASANSPAAADSGSAESPTNSSAKIAKVDQDRLPIGQYLPWLDDDRVRVAIPIDWHTLPRDADYLVRFYHTDRNGLPRINVSVEPADFGGMTDTTVDNVREFAQQVAQQLHQQSATKDTEVYPMMIGNQPCASYLSQVGLQLAPDKTLRADRQRLLVLRGGRLYTIDLLTLSGLVAPSRGAAYAVCASLEFGDGTGDAPPTILSEEGGAPTAPTEPAPAAP